MLIPQPVMTIGKIAAPPGGQNNNSQVRFGLDVVHVERDKEGKPVAVATDGRRIIIAHWEEDLHTEYPSERVGDPAPVENYSCNVPVTKWMMAADLVKKVVSKAVLRLKPVLNNVLLQEVEGDKETVLLGVTDLESVHKIDTRLPEAARKFPAWRNVVHRPELVTYPEGDKRAVQFAMDGDTLKGLVDACTQASGNGRIFLVCPLDTNKPMMIKAVGPDHGISVVAFQEAVDKAKEGKPANDKKKPPQQAGFHIQTRKLAETEHWVIVDNVTGKVIAQQPLDIECISPVQLEKLIRVKAVGASEGEAVVMAANLGEGPRAVEGAPVIP